MKTEIEKTAEELFELGAMRIRDYKGHEQELMNKGTFIELFNNYASQDKMETEEMIQLNLSTKFKTDKWISVEPDDYQFGNWLNENIGSGAESIHKYRAWIKSLSSQDKWIGEKESWEDLVNKAFNANDHNNTMVIRRLNETYFPPTKRLLHKAPELTNLNK